MLALRFCICLLTESRDNGLLTELNDCRSLNGSGIMIEGLSSLAFLGASILSILCRNLLIERSLLRSSENAVGVDDRRSARWIIAVSKQPL